jgi:hypothetical protein
MEFALVVLAVGAVNLAAVAMGYYVGLGHLDRMLDIDEDSREAPFPPDFSARESEQLGPLSAEDIDDIDDWDRRN